MFFKEPKMFFKELNMFFKEPKMFFKELNMFLQEPKIFFKEPTIFLQEPAIIFFWTQNSQCCLVALAANILSLTGQYYADGTILYDASSLTGYGYF